MLRSGIPYVKRHFCLDKPFWIVMREKNNLPYFVAHIVNLEGSQWSINWWCDKNCWLLIIYLVLYKFIAIHISIINSLIIISKIKWGSKHSPKLTF